MSAWLDVKLRAGIVDSHLNTIIRDDVRAERSVEKRSPTHQVETHAGREMGSVPPASNALQGCPRECIAKA